MARRGSRPLRWVQWCPDRGHHVCCQHGRVAAARISEEAEEVGQTGVAVVELVISELEDVEAHLVHQRSVGFTLEQTVEERAGDGIAGVNLHHVATGVCFGELVHLGHDRWEATDLYAGGLAREVKVAAVGVEVRVMVIHVEDRELEVALAVGELRS